MSTTQDQVRPFMHRVKFRNDGHRGYGVKYDGHWIGHVSKRGDGDWVSSPETKASDGGHGTRRCAAMRVLYYHLKSVGGI